MNSVCLHMQESSEPNLVKWAIGRARVKDFSSMTLDHRRSSFRPRRQKTIKAINVVRYNIPLQLYYNYLAVIIIILHAVKIFSKQQNQPVGLTDCLFLNLVLRNVQVLCGDYIYQSFSLCLVWLLVRTIVIIDYTPITCISV